ncbi:MAG: sortase [Clostridia bacterium]|nr:sortase [Clostridia bacterium]
MRSRRGLALILAGVICLLSAAGFAVYNVLDAKRAEQSAAEGLAAVMEALGSSGEEASTGEGESNSSDPSGKTYPSQTPRELKTVEKDGRVYVGIVEVPSLGLSLPVLKDWDYDNLRIAPCRYAGSCYTGDMVLCAHNYVSHFGPLLSADIGAEVTFTTVLGETFRYVIVNRETLRPGETERLVTADNWQLTLFTCFLGGTTRCVLRCEEIPSD